MDYLVAVKTFVTSGLLWAVDYCHQLTAVTSWLLSPVDCCHRLTTVTGGLLSPVDYLHQWTKCYQWTTIINRLLCLVSDYCDQWTIVTSWVLWTVDYCQDWTTVTSRLLSLWDYFGHCTTSNTHLFVCCAPLSVCTFAAVHHWSVPSITCLLCSNLWGGAYLKVIYGQWIETLRCCYCPGALTNGHLPGHTLDWSVSNEWPLGWVPCSVRLLNGQWLPLVIGQS